MVLEFRVNIGVYLGTTRGIYCTWSKCVGVHMRVGPAGAWGGVVMQISFFQPKFGWNLNSDVLKME
jgi:hypothetical protein